MYVYTYIGRWSLIKVDTLLAMLFEMIWDDKSRTTISYLPWITNDNKWFTLDNERR